MKTTGIHWIVSCILLAGCVHTHEIGNEETQTPRDSVPGLVVGKEVVLNVYDAAPIHGTAIKVRSDTLWLQRDSSYRIVRVQMRTVESIETEGSSTGPIVGLLVGSLVGAGIGALAEANTGGGSGGIGLKIDPVVLSAVLGGAIGLAIGANVTPGDRYLFPDSGRIKSEKPMTSLERSGPTEYVVVVVKTILEETETSIIIPWAGGKVTLPKSEITMTHSKDGIDIKVPKWLWQSQQ
jgi:hypothetical protein